MVDQRIIEEQKRNELISSQGTGGLVAGLVAGLFDVDAAMLIPPIKGGKLLSISGKSARNAAIGTASQEVLLQQTQLTRTGEESVLNVGTSAVLGGLLGPAMSLVLPKSYNYIKSKFDKPFGRRPDIIRTDPKLKATDADETFDKAAADIGASTSFHGFGSVGAAVNPAIYQRIQYTARYTAKLRIKSQELQALYRLDSAHLQALLRAYESSRISSLRRDIIQKGTS